MALEELSVILHSAVRDAVPSKSTGGILAIPCSTSAVQDVKHAYIP